MKPSYILSEHFNKFPSKSQNLVMSINKDITKNIISIYFCNHYKSKVMERTVCFNYSAIGLCSMQLACQGTVCRVNSLLKEYFRWSMMPDRPKPYQTESRRKRKYFFIRFARKYNIVYNNL